MKFTQRDLIDILEKNPKQSKKVLDDIAGNKDKIKKLTAKNYEDWDEFTDAVMKAFKLGAHKESLQIEIVADVKLPESNIILEKGDKVKIIPIKERISDSYVNSYLESLMWSDGELDEYTVYDVEPNSRRQAEKDLEEFTKQAQRFLTHDADESQIAHDFALTRNGHGAGFWSRPEIYGKVEADRLTELAKSFGETYIYAGDSEGVVYID